MHSEQAIPTNIITGFLGAGKTSAILNLLQQKPAGERWGILVNEFGEIGIDGSLVQGSRGADGEVFVREVPGGCMCCASGLPMQMALNQLLNRAELHRLLIEPTGLGHPMGVLETLSSDHNRDLLSIQKTIALVDARNLSDDRYTNHATFRQQLAIADIVVANKDDLYTERDRRKLRTFVEDLCGSQVNIICARQGRFEPAFLNGETKMSLQGVEPDISHSTPVLAGEQPIPECGYLTAINQGEGFESIGWRFSPDLVFDRHGLRAFFDRLIVERMKAVFITSNGVFGYNMTRDGLTEIELDDCVESRIEIIADRVDSEWVNDLTGCYDTGYRSYSV
ncbi:MAG: GTP-binding protein [Pseudomonadota bacterium]